MFNFFYVENASIQGPTKQVFENQQNNKSGNIYGLLKSKLNVKTNKKT